MQGWNRNTLQKPIKYQMKHDVTSNQWCLSWSLKLDGE